MYDKFNTYAKNHSTSDVKNTEIKKISKDKRKIDKAHRKMKKHKYHGILELEEHYDDILQAEFLIKKTSRNINTRKKRLQNFTNNGHVE